MQGDTTTGLLWNTTISNIGIVVLNLTNLAAFIYWIQGSLDFYWIDTFYKVFYISEKQTI